MEFLCKLTFLYSQLSQVRHSKENGHLAIDELLVHLLFVVPLKCINTRRELAFQKVPVVVEITGLSRVIEESSLVGYIHIYSANH